MIYLIGGYVIFIIGMVCGALFNPEETCPRAVKGYNCLSNGCDHRKSTLYQAKLDMALGAEAAEREKLINGGSDHE